MSLRFLQFFFSIQKFPCFLMKFEREKNQKGPQKKQLSQSVAEGRVDRWTFLRSFFFYSVVFGTSSSIVSAAPQQSNHVEMERIYIFRGSSVSPTADTILVEKEKKKTKIVPLMSFMLHNLKWSFYVAKISSSISSWGAASFVSSEPLLLHSSFRVGRLSILMANKRKNNDCYGSLCCCGGGQQMPEAISGNMLRIFFFCCCCCCSSNVSKNGTVLL